MTNTPRRKPVTSNPPQDREASVDLDSTGPSISPEMPHERDETAGMTGGVPSARVQQGERDVKRGVQDTSRAPESDDAYRKLKTP